MLIIRSLYPILKLERKKNMDCRRKMPGEIKLSKLIPANGQTKGCPVLDMWIPAH